MYLVLGGGISGISAAYHLTLAEKKAVIFEEQEKWGGLCGNFEVDGFRYDYAIHLSFTKNDYVKKLLFKDCEYSTHVPTIGNIYKDHWIKHPAQNNLYPLPIEEKVKILIDFIENKNPTNQIQNYEMWLRAQYGNYFAENFPMEYTKKYWTVEAKLLSTSWIGNRMYRPSLEEVLRGSLTEDTPNTYYAQKMYYPSKGGFKGFLKFIASKCEIKLNKKAVSIDPVLRKVIFGDGSFEHYETIISSIPLPELIKIIKDVPNKIIEASEKLNATSVCLVSLGFNRPDIPEYLWFYIYNKEFYPARCYSPSLKSENNVPSGCSSLQFEVHFSKYKPLPFNKTSIISHVIDQGIALKLFNKNDIIVADARYISYGNVLFKQGMDDARKIIHNYLKEIDIRYCGRFGEWDYLWSDQSLLSGKKVVDEILS